MFSRQYLVNVKLGNSVYTFFTTGDDDASWEDEPKLAILLTFLR